MSVNLPDNSSNPIKSANAPCTVDLVSCPLKPSFATLVPIFAPFKILPPVTQPKINWSPPSTKLAVKLSVLSSGLALVGS